MRALLILVVSAMYVCFVAGAIGQGVSDTSAIIDQSVDSNTLDQQTQSLNGVTKLRKNPDQPETSPPATETAPPLVGTTSPEPNATKSTSSSATPSIASPFNPLNDENLKKSIAEGLRNRTRATGDHLTDLQQRHPPPTNPPSKPGTSSPSTALAAAQEYALDLNGADWIYSGYLVPKHGDKLPFFTKTQFYTRAVFNENNSFIGKGRQDTYTGALGGVIDTRYGFEIQPDFAYKYASRELADVNTMYADSYAGSVQLTQKVFPLAAAAEGQPNLVYNLREPNETEIHNKEDIAPNFSVRLGFLGAITASPTRMTLTRGTRVMSSQDAWDAVPSINFDFALWKKTTGTFGQGFSMSIVPSWDDTLTSNNTGGSASTGAFQLQGRNTYIMTWNKITSLQLIEYNTLLRDTNEERLPTDTTPIAYQTWAKIGSAVVYDHVYDTDRDGLQKHIVARVEYSYEAFNAQYEAHNVLATMSIDF